MSDLEIEITEEDLIKMNKLLQKKYIHRTVKEASLKYLLEENETKFKTKHIQFEELEMSPYLVNNKSTALSNIIFSERSGTLYLKNWHECNYTDKLCVMCKLSEETIDQFMSCPAYGKKNIIRKGLENYLWK